jgi:TolB-like protein/Flp pilus assembly protein TadD
MPADPIVFSFGSFILSPGASTLLRDGMPLPVSYRGLRILAALVQRKGEVVRKAELIDEAWEGAAVEEANLTVQIAALRKLLGSAPDGTEWILTVPRVGYRFSGTAPASAALDAPPTQDPAISIAVMAFTNLGGAPQEDFFAEGLAEDLIASLSRIRGLLVSARNSSFTYKDRSTDAQRIGADLGVRYILQGSVRRSGDRMRIVAQLIDAPAGVQTWTERYDVELADFLTLQDQIAESVTAAIEPRLYAAEHNRLKGRAPESLNAWGLVMRSMPYVWTWGSPQEIAIAQDLLRHALRVSPGYARANSLLAWTHAAQVQLGWTEDRRELDVALALSRQAVAADPEDAWAHLALGYTHMVNRRTDAALEELREAVDLNSSLAIAYIILGSTFAYAGMFRDGLHELSHAARLSPRDFTQAANHACVGLCHLMAGQFAEAVEAELRAVELRPHFGTAWRTLAAAAGLAGDRKTGERALAEAKRLHPALSLAWIENFHPIVQSEHRAIYIKGLRASGMEA